MRFAPTLPLAFLALACSVSGSDVAPASQAVLSLGTYDPTSDQVFKKRNWSETIPLRCESGILRLSDVQAGQHLVAGVWTINFTFTDAEAARVRNLINENALVVILFDGMILWEFRDPSSPCLREQNREQVHVCGGLDFCDEASVRALVQRIHDAHCLPR